MHARFESPGTSAGPIQGTFYPSAAAPGGNGAPLLARLVPVLLGVLALRAIARASRHHRVGHPARKMKMIARVHRELHAREAAAEAAEVTA